MGVVAWIASVVFVALVLFLVVMWGRLILDWTRALRPSWRPSGPLLILAEVCYWLTDPPLRLVRRVVKPIVVAGAKLDFSWSIVLIGCVVLLYVAGALRYL